MSRTYDSYLEEHKANVAKGFKWLQEYLPDTLVIPGEEIDLEHQICFAHDASKNEADEYEAYDAYFYGGNRSFQVTQDFNYAWLRHIHRNPHHWQYWVLNCDDPDEGEIILDMPYPYIVEMICDWWAFSWAKGDLTEMFSWYKDHQDYIKLSLRTRVAVEKLLYAMMKRMQELGLVNKTGKWVWKLE